MTENIDVKGWGKLPQIVMRDENLSFKARSLYAYLIAFRGDADEAWPSTKLMMKELGACRNTIGKYRRQLVDAGLIKFHVKRGMYNGDFGTWISYEFTDDEYMRRREPASAAADDQPEASRERDHGDVRAERCLRDLAGMSIKPVRESAYKSTLQAVRRRLREGYTPPQLVAAYANYARRYRKENQTDKYAKQLESWLNSLPRASATSPAVEPHARPCAEDVAKRPGRRSCAEISFEYDRLKTCWEHVAPENIAGLSRSEQAVLKESAARMAEIESMAGWGVEAAEERRRALRRIGEVSADGIV